jgi:hypothetical protein
MVRKENKMSYLSMFVEMNGISFDKDKLSEMELLVKEKIKEIPFKRINDNNFR